jgi:hypothetical protein
MMSRPPASCCLPLSACALNLHAAVAAPPALQLLKKLLLWFC